MRALFHRVIFGSATLAASVTFAQMHKVAKPQQVVRAVGVYEWTGDFAKPTASRLIPVSLYIEGKFEDAGVYIARPVPFALLSGNVYFLQAAGIDKGTLDLAYAKHLQAVEATGDLAFDDGWFGYGSVRPLSAPRKTTHALKPSKTLSNITTSSSDPSRPHLTTKTSGDTAPAAGSDPEQAGPDNQQARYHNNSRYNKLIYRRRLGPANHEASRQLQRAPAGQHGLNHKLNHQHNNTGRRSRPAHHEAPQLRQHSLWHRLDNNSINNANREHTGRRSRPANHEAAPLRHHHYQHRIDD